MKGKLFNVRGEAAIKIAENKEIAEIKQIFKVCNIIFIITNYSHMEYIE